MSQFLTLVPPPRIESFPQFQETIEVVRLIRFESNPQTQVNQRAAVLIGFSDSARRNADRCSTVFLPSACHTSPLFIIESRKRMKQQALRVLMQSSSNVEVQ
ncbi:MAG: hypothetical protein HYR58_02565 [Acidobacteria bacterium]|nr:hypothetical protein [Acidobacteriota bacterium]